MARCLIVGCGCHGRELARDLVQQGHVVRGTTRQAETLPAISAAGAEGLLADPDRIATIVPALDHVTVIILLLGSASGSDEQLRALHGPRLEMLLTKILDTTVHGIVYEAEGSVDPALLTEGAARVERVCAQSRIGCAMLRCSRDDPQWLPEAMATVGASLSR